MGEDTSALVAFGVCSPAARVKSVISRQRRGFIIRDIKVGSDFAELRKRAASCAVHSRAAETSEEHLTRPPALGKMLRREHLRSTHENFNAPARRRRFLIIARDKARAVEKAAPPPRARARERASVRRSRPRNRGDIFLAPVSSAREDYGARGCSSEPTMVGGDGDSSPREIL